VRLTEYDHVLEPVPSQTRRWPMLCGVNRIDRRVNVFTSSQRVHLFTRKPNFFELRSFRPSARLPPAMLSLPGRIRLAEGVTRC
jgi:hypothetical protein